MSYSNEKEVLIQGIQELGLKLQESKIDRLMAYLGLFDKWNRTFNLSAIREPMDMVKLHLLDSLSVAPHLNGTRFLDVGTGGGLPGIPLAIVYPEKFFTLLDSAGKKTRFLVQVCQNLKLTNVVVENRRVESYKPAEAFDGIISRAFASLKDMTDSCEHLLSAGGRFWAMKGLYPQDELRVIEKHYRVEHVYELRVPGVPAQRCLLCIAPVSNPP